MEQTLPPLVSEYDTQNLWDDVVRPVVKAMEKQLGQCSPAFQAGEMGRAIIPIYEADCRRTREVVQALVNGINDARFALFGCGKVELANALSEIEILAKSQLNIDPTK